MDEGSINMVSLVPTMLSAILDARDDKPFPDTMRVVLLGGGAASSTLLERARKLQLPLSTTWGMTESASQVATAFPGEISADGFVGPPLPFARVTQQDQTLHIQGPLVGGSLQTSDRGAISDNGLIQIDGRDDDVIISGGKKFNPREIEEALTRHPAIAEAGVVGVPDEKWGERIAAVLVSPPGLEALSSDEVLLWCREHLGAHHTPKEVHWRSGLPRNDMGKIVRDRLRKEICP